jgi:hypothetical protein
MTEVIGLVVSIDNEKMIIIDDDNDEIEMYHSNENGIMIISDESFEIFKQYVNCRVSYYYDENGININRVNKDYKPFIRTTNLRTGRPSQLGRFGLEYILS